jgi:transposase InsO family protein
VLDRLAHTRSLPRVLRTDNGLEFCGRAMLTWAHERGVELRLSAPRKPTPNAYIEFFNGRFRDEGLNEQLAALIMAESLSARVFDPQHKPFGAGDAREDRQDATIG